MNKKEFIYLINNTIKVNGINHYDSIFYCYNKNIERQIKYHTIFNINKEIKYTFDYKDIYFEERTIIIKNIAKKQINIEYDLWELLLPSIPDKKYDIIKGWLSELGYMFGGYFYIGFIERYF